MLHDLELGATRTLWSRLFERRHACMQHITHTASVIIVHVHSYYTFTYSVQGQSIRAKWLKFEDFSTLPGYAPSPYVLRHSILLHVCKTVVVWHRALCSGKHKPEHHNIRFQARLNIVLQISKSLPLPTATTVQAKNSKAESSVRETGGTALTFKRISNVYSKRSADTIIP